MADTLYELRGERILYNNIIEYKNIKKGGRRCRAQWQWGRCARGSTSAATAVATGVARLSRKYGCGRIPPAWSGCAARVPRRTGGSGVALSRRPGETSNERSGTRRARAGGPDDCERRERARMRIARGDAAAASETYLVRADSIPVGRHFGNRLVAWRSCAGEQRRRRRTERRLTHRALCENESRRRRRFPRASVPCRYLRPPPRQPPSIQYYYIYKHARARARPLIYIYIFNQ